MFELYSQCGSNP